MKDERSQKRRHLVYYLSVHDRNTDQPIGRVVDITTEGFKLCSELPVDIDQTYQLRMDLPRLDGESQHLNLDAQGIWSSRDINPDLWDIGFKMVNADSEVKETITRLIDAYSFPDTSTEELR